MDNIAVELRAPTKRGRLFPRNEDDPIILMVESAYGRGDCPYYVNLDNTINFDLGADGLLMCIEVVSRKTHWWIERESFVPPAGRAADLAFAPAVLAAGYIELPVPGVKIVTDRSRRHVLISFAGDVQTVESVELSDTCTALVSKNRLVGFYLDLGINRG